MRYRIARSLLIAVALVGAAGEALAQAYPNRATRLIVSFPPGGPADLLGRFIAQKLSESFGQQVVVENRPGANSIIAAELTAGSAPDGYTLLMAIDGVLVMNPSLYSKLPYDPIKDFAPVGLVALIPNLIVANNAFAANSFRELVARAKAEPGKINVGTGALPVQLAFELLMRQAGMKMQIVPYKGGNTTITALMANEVPVTVEGISTGLPFIRAGKVKALAVTSAERLRQAPEIPTVAESGVPGYSFAVWQSVVAPARTPRPVIDRLNAELQKMMQLPEARERLGTLGIEPAWGTPEDLAERIRVDGEKWGKIIHEIGLKLD